MSYGLKSFKGVTYGIIVAVVGKRQRERESNIMGVTKWILGV